MKRKRFSGFKGKKFGLSIETKTFKGGTPTKEKISKGSDVIEYKAFKDLAFRGAIEVKADPNTEAAAGSYPYHILNNTNKVVEANYPGYDNISGNAIVKLQNSLDTQFYNLVDSIAMEKRINYNYMAIDGDSDNSNAINIAYNIEILKAVQQALSTGYSTMLTQLAFYTDCTNTDMPRGSATSPIYIETPFPTDSEANKPKIITASDDYAKVAALVFYQVTMQNLVSPLAKYTEVMSLEDEMMNMSYRREAPIITQLFGQFKKKAFIAQLNAVGASILGEYFDTNWWTQVNTFRHIPSRKACDMNNPLITVVSSHVSPDIRLYTGGQTPVLYFDSTATGSKGFKLATADLLDPESFKYVQYTNMSLEQLVMNLNKLLDAHYILRWARRVNEGVINNSQTHCTTASAYYRQVCDYIDKLSWFASKFSSNMNEIRTFLDKMQQTGLIYWKKGQKFSIEAIKTLSLTYNQVTADVLKNSLAGAENVNYDDITKRWGCSTEWNMYTGINEYDAKSGGAFFTFSLRNINRTYTPAGQTSTTTIALHDSRMLLPILFDSKAMTFTSTGSTHWVEASSTNYTPAQVKGVTRKGALVCLGSRSYNNSAINTSVVLARLNPIFDTSLSIKAPNVNATQFVADNGQMSAAERNRQINMVNKVLVQTCGYASVVWSSSTYEQADPDLLCFVDLQLEDVSNEMITYARNYSPFRVATPDGKRTMGFGKN